jgi:protein regulator of cytokinesis 1
MCLLQLEDEKSRREAHIQSIFDQLDVLWKRLGIPDEDIDEFVELNRGSTLQTIRAYENELEHMQQVKREKMSIFIRSAREEIKNLWEDLIYGDVEREAFAALHDGEHRLVRYFRLLTLMQMTTPKIS